MAQDYNQTLNLPSTDFSMRGNLTQKEPKMLDEWAQNSIYFKLMEKNKDLPPYILHDGPPYANGDIHLGTALNKILKDIIIKYKNMSGYCAPYIPGWDTHGLPIELRAMKDAGLKNGMLPPLELREKCKEFALSYVNIQKQEFLRLGIWGDFDHPYLTLQPEFEAKQVEVFGEMAKRGYIYKGLKPVYWCPECQTALAEAEIEYANDPCTSIYVKFKVTDDKGKLSSLNVDVEKTYFVIWTTTTWTLPGNVAICVGPEYEYTAVQANGEFYIMAKDLVEPTMNACKIVDYTCLGTILGKELEYVRTRHPFLDRDSLVIIGDHVTLESGTGCVHTAPGYGVDDFEVCRKYDELGIIVGVDDKGILTEESGKEFAGLSTGKAHAVIAKHMEQTGALLGSESIEHQYPHCWRCKSPILFRATEQWFCSVEDFKEETIRAIESVKWIPEWGEERIKGMVRDRSDWCISRQRTWGVPIPILYCKDCGKFLVNDETIHAISDLFRREGADAWYRYEPEEFLPDSVRCDCGCHRFTKEMNIMDVWFDSGSTHEAVMKNRPELSWPADLYLEGSDQYRGWFQSSLLTSVVLNGAAPYKAICTHGWVVDGDGKAMHKSLGNSIQPEEIIKQYGADILRLWVASSDYHSDIRLSQGILKQLSEAYKKIRNTARFLLGNLCNGNGFSPDGDSVSFDKLFEIDKLALLKFDALIDKVNGGYASFDYHVVYHAIHNFCVTDMSNFYLDIIKDRLYCTKEDSIERRSAQTVMYRILSGLARLIAPVLTFTAEEIWKFIPRSSVDDAASIILNPMPEKSGLIADEGFTEKWNLIGKLREDAKKALEIKRAEKFIGSALEAKLLIYCTGELFEKIQSFQNEFPTVFIVSAVEIVPGGSGEYTGDFSEVSFTVAKAEGEKCERCWTWSDSVGKCEEHPTLCKRCVEEIQSKNLNK